MIKYYCDLCGKELERRGDAIILQVNHYSQGNKNIASVEICTGCGDKYEMDRRYGVKAERLKKTLSYYITLGERPSDL